MVMFVYFLLWTDEFWIQNTTVFEIRQFLSVMYKYYTFGNSRSLLHRRKRILHDFTRGVFNVTGKWTEKLNGHLRLNVEKYWKDRLHVMDVSMNNKASISDVTWMRYWTLKELGSHVTCFFADVDDYLEYIVLLPSLFLAVSSWSAFQPQSSCQLLLLLFLKIIIIIINSVMLMEYRYVKVCDCCRALGRSTMCCPCFHIQVAHYTWVMSASTPSVMQWLATIDFTVGT